MGPTEEDRGEASRRFSDGAYPHQQLTEAIISAAVEVHRELGPGYVESVYETALVIELQARGHEVRRQIVCDVMFKGQPVGRHRLDIMVDDEVVVELKSVDILAAVHAAQLRSTLKAFGKTVGLLMNFNQARLIDGLKRVIN